MEHIQSGLQRKRLRKQIQFKAAIGLTEQRQQHQASLRRGSLQECELDLPPKFRYEFALPMAQLRLAGYQRNYITILVIEEFQVLMTRFTCERFGLGNTQ